MPEYGEAAGVSFDDPEASLAVLAGYHYSISLVGEEYGRCVRIGTAPGVACEYCCPVDGKGFLDPDGTLSCECSHNRALSGLAKWLIRNTGYTGDRIIQEIRRWKAAFFPREAVMEELKRRGLAEILVDPPKIVGEC
jgi:hypothetical protein